MVLQFPVGSNIAIPESKGLIVPCDCRYVTYKDQNSIIVYIFTMLINCASEMSPLLRELFTYYSFSKDYIPLFKCKKIYYLLLNSSQDSNKNNIYINPSMDIVPQSIDVHDPQSIDVHDPH